MERKLHLGSFVVTYLAAAPAFAQTSASMPASSASAPEGGVTPGGKATWMVGGLVLGLIVGYLIGTQAGRRKLGLAA